MSDLQVRGPLFGGTGSPSPFTADFSGAQRVTDAHGRFFEACTRGNLYTTGMQSTSINNATFTTADALSATLATAATSTPIVGIWNPQVSLINAVVLQATLAVVETALAAGGCGGFVWVGYSQQAAITVASQAVPINRKTFQASGSQIKGLSGLALTGLTTIGAYLGASALGGGSIINGSQTQVLGTVPIQAPAVENLDGSFVVAPGGILGLFCSATPVAHSAAASILWEEVPILP